MSETATSSLQELLLIKGGGFLFFNFNVASEKFLSYYIGFLLENNSETFFSFGEGGRRRRRGGGSLNISGFNLPPVVLSLRC